MPFFDATLAVEALIGRFIAFGRYCEEKHRNWPAATDTVISLNEEMKELHDFLLSPKFTERVDTGDWNQFTIQYEEISAAFTAANAKPKPTLVSKAQSGFTKADAHSIEKHKQLKAVLARITKLVEDIMSAVSMHDEEERLDSVRTAREEAHHARTG